MATRIMNPYRRNVMQKWLASISSGNNIYTFIGKETAWPDDNLPPTPEDSFDNYYQTHYDMLSLKKVSSINFVPATRSIRWTSGKIYDEYDSRDPDIFISSEFYVANSTFDIYKCISNNGGIASTVQPVGTGTTNITTGDGYVWKYLYTILPSDIASFVTNDWLPVYQNSTVQAAAIDGSINKINVISGGTGYTSATVTINSNTGSGATATALISGGVITRINVTNVGQGYRDATITITGNGAGATAYAVLPPFGGHGSNVFQELGVKNLLLNVQLIGDEGGDFPVDISYRQIGLIINPLLTNGNTATAATYQKSEILTGSGEIIYLSNIRPIFRSSTDAKSYSFIIVF